MNKPTTKEVKVMKRISFFIFALLVAIAGCGGTNPPAIAQCDTNEDCTLGCDGYDSSICSIDGICFCSDAIPTTSCDRDGDCAEDCSAYDSHSCSGGICYCRDEAEVQCAEDLDCESRCFETYTARCYGGTCTCTPDKECPAITRRDLVEMIYTFLGLSMCPSDNFENPCPNDDNVIDGSIQACQWAALVDEGLISIYTDPDGNPIGLCGPQDNVIRAAFVKMLINAIGGLADYQAPATPTFGDVPADAWFFDSVEAAVQLGIVSGYTDAAGNLTGLFGPADLATTCWADEVLLRAASYLPQTDTGTLIFSIYPLEGSLELEPQGIHVAGGLRVLSDMPFGNYRAVFNDLPGYHTPDPTELYLSSDHRLDMLDVVYEQRIEGDLVVSLNADTPPSSTLPKGATHVELAYFDFTVTQDTDLESMVIMRGGVGQHDDWDSLYLYDGARRLTDAFTIDSITNTINFSLGLGLVLEVGTTTLQLVGDVSPTAGTSNQHYFYLASAGDVVSDAQVVTGDFPVASNTFTIGNVSVSTVTISVGTTPVQPRAGQQDAEISAFRLTAGSTDVALHRITLTQGGTLSSTKLLNLRLLRGADEVASATSFDGDRITFVLDTPFVVAAGQTNSFYVRCDIDGGRSGDTIQLFLADPADLLVVDQQYGFGATVLNQLTAGDVEPLVLQGARLVITDNGPVAFTVPPGTSDVDVLLLGLTGDVDLTVRDTRLVVRAYDTSGDLVSTADEGVYASLKMLQVVNTNASSTLAGPMTTVAHGDRNEQSGQVWYSKVLAEDYDLIGGQTRNLAIRLDVDATFPSDYSFDVEFSLIPEGGGTSYVKDMAANEYLDGDNIIGDPVVSRRVTVE